MGEPKEVWAERAKLTPVRRRRRDALVTARSVGVRDRHARRHGPRSGSRRLACASSSSTRARARSSCECSTVRCPSSRAPTWSCPTGESNGARSRARWPGCRTPTRPGTASSTEARGTPAPCGSTRTSRRASARSARSRRCTRIARSRHRGGPRRAPRPAGRRLLRHRVPRRAAGRRGGLRPPRGLGRASRSPPVRLSRPLARPRRPAHGRDRRAARPAGRLLPPGRRRVARGDPATGVPSTPRWASRRWRGS